MRAIFSLALAVAVSAEEGMLLVPEGEFIMGSDTGHPDEAPRRSARLPAFYVDRSEISAAAFAEFARAVPRIEDLLGPWFRDWPAGADIVLERCAKEGCPEPLRRAAEAAARGARDPQAGGLPARWVGWRDADAFCRWAGKRLPTEAEWEKAARGVDGRSYPWGDAWDPARARAGLAPEAGPAPAGAYPGGASPYGALDMAGNLWEWTADWYDWPEPAGEPGLRSAGQGREPRTRRALRGGGFSGALPGQAAYNSRVSRRAWSDPEHAHPDTGFRCVK